MPTSRSLSIRTLFSAVATLAATCLVPVPGVAQSEGTVELTRQEEATLAREAGPANLAADATVYVTGPDGYEVESQGTNGASCLVSRAPNGTLEPICFDAEGTRTILPVQMERGRMRAAGQDEAEITARIDSGLESGEFSAPSKAGIAYMLSDRNLVFNGNRVVSYPPHVMVYAPFVTNEDIGFDGSDGSMPWVLQEGTAHAYIMVIPRGSS
ncbi:MAG: hypothetical protein GKS06_13375 [Acidobacteria bacterium]|nr:hypothetical protein [Acidobacteriota bacterium]